MIAVSMIATTIAPVSVVLVVSAVTARWSSARARRQMTTFLKRAAALPSIDTKLAVRTDTSRTPTEARLYFLDAYRATRKTSPPARAARTPGLSLERPSPAHGA